MEIWMFMRRVVVWLWDSVAEVAQVGRRCDWLARGWHLIRVEKYVMCI